eukprot:1125151-Alexandrium_andersonii.AAC.1
MRHARPRRRLRQSDRASCNSARALAEEVQTRVLGWAATLEGPAEALECRVARAYANLRDANACCVN